MKLKPIIAFGVLSAVLFTNFSFAQTKELYGIAGPHLQYQTPTQMGQTYKVRGETYTTKNHDDVKHYVKEGTASYYHSKFNGRRTSSGETYNSALYTAAHKTLPLNSYAVVTNLKNNRKVIVKINDRGPFSNQRIIDLSGAAARELGIVQAGLGRVKVEGLHVDRRGKVSGAGAKTLAKTTKSEKGKQNLESQTLVKENLPKSTKSAVETGEIFKIKMMNLASKQKADRVIAQLALENIQTEVQQNGKKYDIHFGPLSSKEQANQLKARLQNLPDKQPLIVYSFNN